MSSTAAPVVTDSLARWASAAWSHEIALAMRPAVDINGTNIPLQQAAFESPTARNLQGDIALAAVRRARGLNLLTADPARQHLVEGQVAEQIRTTGRALIEQSGAAPADVAYDYVAGSGVNTHLWDSETFRGLVTAVEQGWQPETGLSGVPLADRYVEAAVTVAALNVSVARINAALQGQSYRAGEVRLSQGSVSRTIGLIGRRSDEILADFGLDAQNLELATALRGEGIDPLAAFEARDSIEDLLPRALADLTELDLASRLAGEPWVFQLEDRVAGIDAELGNSSQSGFADHAAQIVYALDGLNVGLGRSAEISGGSTPAGPAA